MSATYRRISSRSLHINSSLRDSLLFLTHLRHFTTSDTRFVSSRFTVYSLRYDAPELVSLSTHLRHCTTSDTRFVRVALRYTLYVTTLLSSFRYPFHRFSKTGACTSHLRAPQVRVVWTPVHIQWSWLLPAQAKHLTLVPDYIPTLT